MMNDLLELLRDVPPVISLGWVAWLGTGAALVVWYRKAQAAALLEPALPKPSARTKPASRPASGTRPLSGSRAAATSAPADVAPEPEPYTADPVMPVVPKAKPKAAPIVVGDPFGDLATLLDQPAAQAEAPRFRTPGESPILNSAGEPMK
jgi:hypothetical protein